MTKHQQVVVDAIREAGGRVHYDELLEVTGKTNAALRQIITTLTNKAVLREVQSDTFIVVGEGPKSEDLSEGAQEKASGRRTAQEETSQPKLKKRERSLMEMVMYYATRRPPQRTI